MDAAWKTKINLIPRMSRLLAAMTLIAGPLGAVCAASEFASAFPNIASASQGAGVGQSCSLDSLVWGLLAAGLVFLATAACMACWGPSLRLLRREHSSRP